MPEFSGRVLGGWALFVAGSALATVLFNMLGLPTPALFGSLLGGMAYAHTAPVHLVIPARAFSIAQGLVGATIGALLSLPALERLVSDAGSVLAVSIGTLAISLLAGMALGLRRDVSTTTGAFALVAGGASGIVALAHDLGADDRVVSIVQYLRVLLILLAMPIVATVLFEPPGGRQTVLPAPATHWPTDVLFTVAAVVVGLLVSRRSLLPAGSLLGPLLVAAALSLSGWLGVVAVPPVLESAGYAVIGAQVGLRFTRADLLGVARLLPVATALIVVVIAACAGMGALLAAVTGIDPLTAYLATTPGGLYAVLAVAADSGADATYVLAVQVIRIFTMLLAAPLVARLLRGGSPPA